MDGGLSRDKTISEEMQKYFSSLQEEITNYYVIADVARKKGLDPELKVEIPKATDLADRVEQLVGPKGIAQEIREATKKIKNRETVSLDISKKIIKDKKYRFKNPEKAIDQAVRTGLAILTEGVLVAPLEGIVDVKIGKNNDGTDYVDLYFSGPIRSAGGTGQAMSVLIADVVRRELGIDKFKPTTGEIERFKEEILLYKRAQHLQYTPNVDEIDLIIKNCPISINGEGTEKVEVTGYRDLPRIGTNRLRGGACLVIAEGLCLKAPKVLKHVKKLKLKGWDFLDVFVNKEKNNEKNEKIDKNSIPEILPSNKYIGDVIAGRPVFSHPSRKGGFRLRYGRSRTGGLASTSINPVSMFLLDEFIAVGTQLKMERPGKATIGTACSEIEGPSVLLKNGDLVSVDSVEQIDKSKIKRIIDLGEILIPFGEFAENNSLLPDTPDCYEWWIQNLQKKLKIQIKKNDFINIIKADEETKEKINEEFKTEIDLKKPLWEFAYKISKKYDISIHPYYNLFWHDISIEELIFLSDYLKNNGKIIDKKLVIPVDKKIKEILIELCVLHKVRNNEIIIDKFSMPLLLGCGLDKKNNKIIETDRKKILEKTNHNENIINLVSKLSGYKVQAKALCRIGTRMGRPEKAAERKMRPPPHVLFPLGNSGGNQRLINKAMQKPSVEIEVGVRTCKKCGKKTYKMFCSCNNHTSIEKNNRIEKINISLSDELKKAQKNIKERTLPETIKGVIGTISAHKTPEMLEKGILRAKHDVSVFKDGTIRFDMTDAPLTHFRPREIDVDVKRLNKMGYEKDIYGEPLNDEDQLCELKVQDVVISKSCAEYFFRVAKFVDDLLVKFYGLKRFYRLKKIEDLTGHLVVGLAPHTSAGALGRIIGFTKAQVCYAHPFYHAAKRRNCLAYDTSLLISNSNNTYISSIKDIYDSIKSNETIIDDFQTKLKKVKSFSTYSFNPKTGFTEKKNIKSIIKAKAPNHLIKIRLSTGREFIGSPYHRVLVYSENKFVRKKLIELNKNDKFFISYNLDIPVKDLDEIDLVKEFLKTNSKNVVLRGIKDFTKTLIDTLGGLKSTSEKLKINKKTLSNYIYRDSIPINILNELLKHTKKDFSYIPKICYLGVKRDYTKIPRIIKINKKLMRLIGYYISEGHARFSSKRCYQIGFACTEEEIREDIINSIKDVFGIEVYRSKSGVFICNHILYDFFTKILKAGENAKNKRIPPLLFSLPKSKMQELLRAYFAGDGSVEKNRLHVMCSSVDKKLLRDIGMQLLRFGIFYRLKEEKRNVSGIAKEYYDKNGKNPIFQLNYISIRSSYARKFCEEIGFSLKRKQRRLESYISKERKPRLKKFGDFIFDSIKEISAVSSDSEYVYDIEVEDLHNFQINHSIVTNNCDSDEDGLMLLMDALLNFSHAYIPDKRGGRMDLPLIITTRLDPSEVDKEAHNLDTLCRYPLDFYESTLRHVHPKDVEKMMNLVSGRLGSEDQYENFGFTHDTVDISEGPKISRYKSLGSMMEKMEAQLSLASLIRAVDTPDVAYKVIERHFLPDIIGNFRAFSKQSVRCAKCNINYRRIPLNGVCTKCGSGLTLTVHEKSVRKYLNISKDVAERYKIPAYANQRIRLVEKSIDSLFRSDIIKTTKLDDFF